MDNVVLREREAPNFTPKEKLDAKTLSIVSFRVWVPGNNEKLLRRAGPFVGLIYLTPRFTHGARCDFGHRTS